VTFLPGEKPLDHMVGGQFFLVVVPQIFVNLAVTGHRCLLSTGGWAYPVGVALPKGQTT
jgi:hypothetical protein